MTCKKNVLQVPIRKYPNGTQDKIVGKVRASEFPRGAEVGQRHSQRRSQRQSSCVVPDARAFLASNQDSTLSSNSPPSKDGQGRQMFRSRRGGFDAGFTHPVFEGTSRRGANPVHVLFFLCVLPGLAVSDRSVSCRLRCACSRTLGGRGIRPWTRMVSAESGLGSTQAPSWSTSTARQAHRVRVRARSCRERFEVLRLCKLQAPTTLACGTFIYFGDVRGPWHPCVRRSENLKDPYKRSEGRSALFRGAFVTFSAE